MMYGYTSTETYTGKITTHIKKNKNICIFKRCTCFSESGRQSLPASLCITRSACSTCVHLDLCPRLTKLVPAAQVSCRLQPPPLLASQILEGFRDAQLSPAQYLRLAIALVFAQKPQPTTVQYSCSLWLDSLCGPTGSIPSQEVRLQQYQEQLHRAPKQKVQGGETFLQLQRQQLWTRDILQEILREVILSIYHYICWAKLSSQMGYSQLCAHRSKTKRLIY